MFIKKLNNGHRVDENIMVILSSQQTLVKTHFTLRTSNSIY